MKKPDLPDQTFVDELLESDQDRFWEIYEENLSQVSEDDAERLVRSTYRSVHEPAHDLFSAVKDAFHPSNSDGYRTEYEVSFTNPLYEIAQNPADLLLTNTDWRDVNLCFVVCEPSGEEYATWANNINEVHDLVTGHHDHLLDQVDEAGKNINHIQYVTCVPKEEVPDADFRFVRRQAASNNHALWIVDDDYSPGPNETPAPMVQLRAESGVMEHGQLKAPLNDGVDYSKSINRDVTIQLRTPVLIALQEVLMALMTENYGVKQEPREFDREDFVDTFIDLCEVGVSGNQKRDLLKERADELIKEAKSADIVHYGSSDRIKTASDFRVRYQGAGTKKLRRTIREKYIKSEIPDKRRQLAYEETVSEFEPKGGVSSDFDDNGWEN